MARNVLIAVLIMAAPIRAARTTVDTAVSGDYVNIVNKGGMMMAAGAALSLDPGGQVVWDASGVEADDAQLSAYLDTNIAKDYVRTHIDAAMPGINDQLTVNVNIDQTCNAFFDGSSSTTALTAGVLRVHGNFTVQFASNFQPSAFHRTVLVGSTSQSVSLSAPSTFSRRKSMSRPSRCMSVRSKSGSAEGLGGGGGGGGVNAFVTAS